MNEQNHSKESDLSEKMEKLGFLTLESNGEEIYLLTATYYFLVVESRVDFERGKRLYDFCKYTYNHRKKQTELQKVYFQNISKEVMIKKVALYLIFMLEKKYLDTLRREEILENAKILSKFE
ncbi:hypothetical protein CUS80_00285 [Enterococcus faecium]|nr:hypothetical protein CUS80_00285 [Enterococcus faecium]